MTFRGIPADAIVLYEELEADNSKTFWEANRDRWKESVRGPAEALAEELAARDGSIGEFHLFRPHVDLRFHKNRPPYKTHQGAFTESDGGAGFYFQISAEGLMAAYGYYAMRKDQLQRFRAAVDGDATGSEIAKLVAKLPRRHEVGAIQELKTAPRGYPRDHPRIDLLRRKGLMVSRRFGAPNWLRTRTAVRKIAEFWDTGQAINAWLDQHVGPSHLEPDGFF